MNQRWIMNPAQVGAMQPPSLHALGARCSTSCDARAFPYLTNNQTHSRLGIFAVSQAHSIAVLNPNNDAPPTAPKPLTRVVQHVPCCKVLQDRLGAALAEAVTQCRGRLGL